MNRQQFLETIWRPVGYGEIRPIKGKKVLQGFFSLSSDAHGVDNALDYVREIEELGGFDIYYGVLPRLRTEGTAAATSPMTEVLWADVDQKHHGHDRIATINSILSFPFSPSILVDSGHGYHAYWLLREPELFDDVQPAMKYIAGKIGGDSTWDPARVLRLPDTRNYKDPEDVEFVRVVLNSRKRYRWSDLEGYAHRWLEQQRRQRLDPATARSDLSIDLPLWLVELIEDGLPKGQRSEAIFKVACNLVRLGWDDEQIRELFHAHPEGIGEKVAERGMGDRYLDVVLKAARERA